MKLESDCIICTLKVKFYLFWTVIANILAFIIIMAVIVGKTNDSIFYRVAGVLLMLAGATYFNMKYLNEKIVINGGMLYHTNFVGVHKKYQISEIKDESTIGGRGRKMIFERGSVELYSYYKNYKEAIKYIDDYKNKWKVKNR